MLHHVGGVTYYTGDEDRALFKLYALPNVVLVLVAHVSCFKHESLSLYFQDDGQQFRYRYVADVGCVPTPPADMVPNVVLGNVTERVVHGLNAQLTKLAVL